jgi:hypothetical protein
MLTRNANPLEAFVDESLRLFARRGYHPHQFNQMRETYGTVEAIERLVRSGEIQSGFKRLQALRMLDRSMEGTVQRFPERFTAEARDCSDFRIKNASDPALRGR